MPPTNPTAVHDLDVNEVKDGLIVYDRAAERVHYLNHTAAFIFQLCDGSRTPAQLAGLVADAFGLDQPPRSEAEECLDQLIREGLVR